MEMDKVYVDENMVISTFLDKPDFFRIDVCIFRTTIVQNRKCGVVNIK